MAMIDISGPISHNMWSYGDPYPAPQIAQIPPPDWLEYPVYSQTVSMAVQSGTYLETAAHMDPARISIDRLPLERCYMIPAVALWLPRGANQPVTAGDLERASREHNLPVQPGDALLIGTGWDSHWNDADYVTNPPYFSADAIDWVLERRVSLLGADTPRYDSPHTPQNFFPKFFSGGDPTAGAPGQHGPGGQWTGSVDCPAPQNRGSLCVPRAGLCGWRSKIRCAF